MTTHLTFMQQFIFKRCPILMLITRETWSNLLSMTETSGWLRYWFSSPHPNSVLILTVIKKTAIWDRLSCSSDLNTWYNATMAHDDKHAELTCPLHYSWSTQLWLTGEGLNFLSLGKGHSSRVSQTQCQCFHDISKCIEDNTDSREVFFYHRDFWDK